MNKSLCVAVTILIAGCAPDSHQPSLEERVDSFDKIENEILIIKRDIETPDAKMRIYKDLYHERHDLQRIAEGQWDQHDHALIRKATWVVLGEIMEKYPDFEVVTVHEPPGDQSIIVPRELPKQPVRAESESVPEEFADDE